MSVDAAILDRGVPQAEKWGLREVGALWALATAVAISGAVLSWLDRGTPGAQTDGAPGQIVTGLAFVALGAVVLTRTDVRRIGWLIAGMGLGYIATCFGQAYIGYGELVDPGSLPLAGWAVVPDIGWLVSVSLSATVLPLVFPTGRLQSTRWRLALGVALGGTAVAVVGVLIDPGSVPRGEHASTAIDGAHGTGSVLGAAGLCAILGVALVALVSLLRRARRTTDPTERAQLRWLLFAAAVLVATEIAQAFLPAAVDDVLEPVGTLVLPAAVTIAILRHRLFEIDVVIARSVVYGGLTIAVVGGYASIVALLDLMLQTGDASFAVSVVASGVVALAFGTVRTWLQGAAERLVYGRRAEPYRVIADLGRRLEAAGTPDEVLPGVVAAITDDLRLPHAMIELSGPDGRRTVAERGTAVGTALTLPLMHHGHEEGRLVVSPRGPDEHFTVAERDLLADLARQVSLAAHAVQLTDGLRRSRLHIVTAREEERRRLRRDLHDGLGPTLAGVTLRLDTVRRRMSAEPDASSDELLRLRRDVQEAIGGIRELVYDLRPPALDELGLVPAVRERAAQLAGLRIEIDSDGRFGDLPAAVEVAAYRIAVEALTNAARHAGARSCAARFAREGSGLRIEVADDGRGLGPYPRPGVGLGSMRERAEELGGSLDIAATPGGGTTVRATLPVAA